MAVIRIAGMVSIAMDEKAGLSLRTQMHKEVAQFIAPKHKAVEMKIEVSFLLST